MDEPHRSSLLHWSGSGWSRVAPPIGARPEDIAARSPDDVWAVGVIGERPLIMHWDGTRWTTMPAPVPWGDLHKVVAVSPGEVWAAGETGRRGGYRALLLRWDGRGWRPQTVPQGAQDFTALESDGHGGVLTDAVTQDEPDARTLNPIIHFTGRGWENESYPETQVGPACVDIARFPGTDRAIAVGGNPQYEEAGTGWIWMRH